MNSTLKQRNNINVKRYSIEIERRKNYEIFSKTNTGQFY